MTTIDNDGPREHIPWPVAIVLIVLIIVALLWVAIRMEDGHDMRWVLIPGTSLLFLYSMVWGNKRHFRTRWFWGLLIALTAVGAAFWFALIRSGVHASAFGFTGIALLELAALIFGFGFLQEVFVKRGNPKDVA